MNNQLKLPWIQSYREIPSISRPAIVAALMAAMRKAGRQLRREGHTITQPDFGNGYVEFTTRRHQLR